MIATNKKARIRARYIETIGYLIIGIILILFMNIGINLFSKAPMEKGVVLSVAGIGILMFVILAAVELPCCFKWGYSASKLVMVILPIGFGFGVPALVIILGKMLPKDVLNQSIEAMIGQLSNHMGLFMVSLVIFMGIALYISYGISLKVAK